MYLAGRSLEDILVRGELVSAPKLVLRGFHAGCIERVFPEAECMYDGKISAAYHSVLRRFFLYVRLNSGKNMRFIQVTSADDPSSESSFSALQPIQVDSWSGCDVMKTSIYFPNVVPNPADNSTLLGFFPINKISSGGAGGKRLCHIAIAVSCDGVRFSTPKIILKNKCRPEGRVSDLVVGGLIVRNATLFFYVHRDMPTPFAVANPTLNDPGLVQHAIPLTRLREFTTDAVLNASPTLQTSCSRIASSMNGRENTTTTVLSRLQPCKPATGSPSTKNRPIQGPGSRRRAGPRV